MRYILCEKQFLYSNTDTAAVNVEILMPRFPSDQHGMLHNFFFSMIVTPLISTNI